MGIKQKSQSQNDIKTTNYEHFTTHLLCIFGVIKHKTVTKATTFICMLLFFVMCGNEHKKTSLLLSLIN